MKVTAAESLLMELLWSRSPRTSEEMIAELGPEQEWSEATIRTLLSRLVKKGAVGVKAEGRRYFYHARIKRAEYLKTESKNFVDRLFGGEITPLVAHFARNRPLKAKDIKALRKLLNELEDGDDD